MTHITMLTQHVKVAVQIQILLTLGLGPRVRLLNVADSAVMLLPEQCRRRHCVLLVSKI